MNVLSRKQRAEPMMSQVPTPVPPMTLSQMAAHAAAHVENLQNERDDAVHRLTAAQNHIAVIEERVALLQQDNERLVFERDHHKARHVAIYTRLQDIISIMRGALEDPPPRTDGGDARVEEALAGLERDLTGKPEEPRKEE